LGSSSKTLPPASSSNASPYAVGFTWTSDQEGEQLGFGSGLSVTAVPVDRYGQVFERLDGGPDAASAVEFEATVHSNSRSSIARWCRSGMPCR